MSMFKYIILASIASVLVGCNDSNSSSGESEIISVELQAPDVVEEGSVVTMKVTSKTQNSDAEMSYQWQVSNNGSIVSISGEASSILTIEIGQILADEVIDVSVTAKGYKGKKVLSHSVLVKNDSGYLLPVSPDLEANSTLVGVDSNNNGVRDDVERKLHSLFSDDARTFSVMLVGASAYQASLLAGFSNNSVEVQKSLQQSSRFVSCYESISEEFSESFDFNNSLVEMLTLNTPERLEYRDKFLTLANGLTVELMSVSDSDCIMESF